MHLIRDYLPWLLSAVTIWMTVLAGNKHPLAWLVGLANQALWLVWIVATAAWGLLPMNLALWIVYGRNHLKWRPATPNWYVHFLRWLHQFEEHPRFNRFGAGLYQLLWLRFCGWTWREAWDCAAIYWFDRKPKTYARST